MNTEDYKNFSISLKQKLLEAPDGHLDATAKELIEKWADPVTSLQILEVMDQCAYAGLASDFTMNVLNTMLHISLKANGETYDGVVAKAHWRKNDKP